MQVKDPQELENITQVIDVVKENKPANILVLGSDHRGEETGRSDTIMLMRLNPEEDRAQIISIPRDSRVKIPGYARNKINAAYALGGTELMIRTVESISGMAINYYVIIDFQGFEKMVDTLGGIDVEVEKRLHDESLHMDMQPGLQHLTGQEALLYVRFRHDIEGDFGRIRRQQQFIYALVDKGKEIRNIFKLPTLANIFAENTTTNLSIGDMIGYGRFLKSLEKDQIETAMLPGEPKNIDGVSYVVLDDAETQKLFSAMREDRSFLASEDQGIDMSDVSVELLNGAGVQGLARDAQITLENLGYNVIKVDNADSSTNEVTKLFATSSNQVKAQMVRESLGVGQVEIDTSLAGQSMDVVVVLGKDYVQLTEKLELQNGTLN